MWPCRPTPRGPPAVLWPTTPPKAFAGNIVGHMDVSLANVVCRGGKAYALIDFEEVGLVARLWDVVRAARHWVPLIHPSDLRGALVTVADRQAERLSAFATTYGLRASERARVVEAALANADATYERMRRGAASGHPGYLREWMGGAAARNRRGRAWVESQREQLERALR